MGKLGGIGFHQQDLQHRLVGGVEAFIQQPERRAEILLGRDPLQATQIQPLVLLQLAGAEQSRHLLVVTLIPITGQDGPQQTLTGDAQGTAIKLIQQQQVLRTAAIVTAQFGTIMETEFVIRDQEEVELNAAIFGQFGDQQALVFQQFETLGFQFVRMTDPDVQIGAATLTDGRGTAHGIEAKNRALMSLDAGVTVGGDTDVFNEVALTGGQLEAGDAVRHFAGDIAWQERMVEMKQDRQQLEELLAMLTHCFQCTLSPGLIHRIIAGYERCEFMWQPTDLNPTNIQTRIAPNSGKSVSMVTTGNSPVNLFSSPKNRPRK